MAQFLIQKGYLKPEQLQEAQKVQQQTRQTFDKVLVDLGFVGEREVLMAKAQEMGVPFVDLDRTPVESSAVNVVPERLVRALQELHPVDRLAHSGRGKGEHLLHLELAQPRARVFGGRCHMCLFTSRPSSICDRYGGVAW